MLSLQCRAVRRPESHSKRKGHQSRRPSEAGPGLQLGNPCSHPSVHPSIAEAQALLPCTEGQGPEAPLRAADRTVCTGCTELALRFPVGQWLVDPHAPLFSPEIFPLCHEVPIRSHLSSTSHRPARTRPTPVLLQSSDKTQQKGCILFFFLSVSEELIKVLMIERASWLQLFGLARAIIMHSDPVQIPNHLPPRARGFRCLRNKSDNGTPLIKGSAGRRIHFCAAPFLQLPWM